jgi:hypothetical protein
MCLFDLPNLYFHMEGIESYLLRASPLVLPKGCRRPKSTPAAAPKIDFEPARPNYPSGTPRPNEWIVTNKRGVNGRYAIFILFQFLVRCGSKGDSFGDRGDPSVILG